MRHRPNDPGGSRRCIDTAGCSFELVHDGNVYGVSGGRRWDLFLSYASPDRDRARVLYQALVRADVSVCFDEAVLRPGDNWHRLLPEHLRASAVVAVLVSSHTRDATFENAEVVMALDQVRREGARLVPVRLHAGAKLPFGTQALQALDYFADDRTARVTEAIVDVVRDPTGGNVVRATQVWSSGIPALPVVFAGRDVLLEQLRQKVSAGGNAVLTQTIHGMGGVGKTTVAAALAAAVRHELDVVWWVRAEQPGVLVHDLAELAPRVGLTDDEAVETDPVTTAMAVRDWLETTERIWLVVFDNAADEFTVEPWKPRRGVGATVITSRNRNMNRLGRVVAVETFAYDVAESFLRDRVRERNPSAAGEDLGAVLARLVGLPLALEQAAAWVERAPNRRFSHYVSLFDDAAAEPFPEGTRPLGYDHTAATAWRVSVDAATAEAAGAGRVLTVLAFVGPGAVPCGWLRAQATFGDAYLDATAAEVDEALVALHGYCLVELTGADSVSVHAVVQAALAAARPPTPPTAPSPSGGPQGGANAPVPLHLRTLATPASPTLVAHDSDAAAFIDHAEDLLATYLVGVVEGTFLDANGHVRSSAATVRAIAGLMEAVPDAERTLCSIATRLSWRIRLMRSPTPPPSVMRSMRPSRVSPTVPAPSGTLSRGSLLQRNIPTIPSSGRAALPSERGSANGTRSRIGVRDRCRAPWPRRPGV